MLGGAELGVAAVVALDLAGEAVGRSPDNSALAVAGRSAGQTGKCSAGMSVEAVGKFAVVVDKFVVVADMSAALVV